MKRIMGGWIVGFIFLAAPGLWAEELSTSTVVSSPTITGETLSAPAPRAMTEPAEAVFVTLTRTAYPTDALPTSVDTVTPEEFRKHDAQNVGDAVAREASVQTLRVGRLGSLSTARIRGSTSNQTLVLIDGRPVGGTSLGTQDLAEIPPEQIDHVEIVRGGVSALYGANAIGGVINVISKRSGHEGSPISNIGYEMASYDRQIYRLNFGSRLGPVDYFFFGNQQWESGFRDNSDARTYNIGGNAGLSMGGAGKILVDLAAYGAKAGVPGQLSPPIPTNRFDNNVEKRAATPVARQITETKYVRTSYILPLPSNSLMNLRLFGSERESDYTDFGDPFFLVDTDRMEHSKGGEAQFELPYGFMVGGNFIHDRLDNTDQITPVNTFIQSVENWGVFVQENFQYERYTFIPSWRYDHHSQAGESSNPRLQAMVDMTPALRLSGSAARSFRAPTIDDLFYPFTNFGGGFSYEGNPNLRPERAWTYDAGFEVHPDSFSFRATYFRANITDLIQTTTDPASQTNNIGSAHRQGVEIQIHQVASELFRHTVNYTYLHNRGTPPGFTNYVTLANSPWHTANYIATLTPGRAWTIDNTGRYVSSRYSSNNYAGTRLGDMFLWDMRVAYRWRQAELYVGANDILDKRYEEQAGFPLPGRTFFGGISIRLWG